MGFLDQLLKSTKNTTNIVKLEFEKNNLEKKLDYLLKDILNSKLYKKVEKEEGNYICMESDKILELFGKIKELENEIKKSKSEYKTIFKKEDKEEKNNESSSNKVNNNENI